MADQATRVFLWATPRSLSTAFFRAMMNKPNAKVIMEPFYATCNPESDSDIANAVAPGTFVVNCTLYEDQKRACEQTYQGFQTVFAKDVAYTMEAERRRYLPDGYIHTFLIRDPHRTVSSDYRTWKRLSDTDWSVFRRHYARTIHLYELYKFVNEHLGQEAIIVDADDLLSQPETIMKKYCAKVGISYDDKMLQWDQYPDKSQMIPDPLWESWYGKAVNSKGFETPQNPPCLDDLPTCVHEAIEENMVYYNEMYSLRIVPEEI